MTRFPVLAVDDTRFSGFALLVVRRYHVSLESVGAHGRREHCSSSMVPEERTSDKGSLEPGTSALAGKTLGSHRPRVDGSGNLRIKASALTSDTDDFATLNWPLSML